MYNEPGHVLCFRSSEAQLVGISVMTKLLVKNVPAMRVKNKNVVNNFSTDMSHFFIHENKIFEFVCFSRFKTPTNEPRKPPNLAKNRKLFCQIS